MSERKKSSSAQTTGVHSPQPSQAGYQDLGFGSKIGRANKRMINQDGSFNVRRIGGGMGAFHPYQYLITISWTKFHVAVVLFYLSINSLFSSLYILAGIHNLTGTPEMGITMPQWLEDFLHAFFFSMQTFTTVGYGSISPMGFATNMIAGAEALCGLMAFALITGVLYGRFSRATAKIRYSKEAVIAPYQQINAFMFRTINRRQSQLIELSAIVTMSWYEKVGNEFKQKFAPLPLERDKVALFPLSWTIVHPITPESPLYGKTANDLERMNAEFMIMIQGYDDTFAQIVHTRTSYKYFDLAWGRKFDMIYHTNEDTGMIVVEVNRIDDHSEARLN
ncbi:MAG: ion channel [Bacteroidia bacterium]|nr:ion channel [Bacteroidia bacterium]